MSGQGREVKPWAGVVRAVDGYQGVVTMAGCEFRRYFADRAYGGPAGGRAAAREWRDRTREALRVELGLERMPHRLLAEPRGDSGVAGVFRGTVLSRSAFSGEVYRIQAWIAQWQPETGPRVQRSRSVQKYGEDEARRLAVKLRQDWERRTYGRVVPNAAEVMAAAAKLGIIDGSRIQETGNREAVA